MTYNYNTSSLLTISANPKTSPDIAQGYLLATLYLAPQKNIINAPHYGIEYDTKAINLSKTNLCKHATTGCSTSCIYHQGIFKHALFEKNKVCNVGLWKYTRHPNYFAEWMVWNGLIIASIPSWILLYNTESMMLWVLLGLGLLFTSRMMYTTLVYHTGAIPSEYYSLKKRPEYKSYQQTTNIFFPGPNKS